MTSGHDDPKNKTKQKSQGGGVKEIDITKCIRKLKINNNIKVLISSLDIPDINWLNCVLRISN